QPDDKGACLSAFSAGPMADLAAGWSPEQRQGNYLEILEEVYPGIADQVGEAEVVNWDNDPVARGGCSFPPPRARTTVAPLLQKAHGRLHFAGEHCSPAFIGYMEGALQSGVRVARRLAERDGLVKKEQNS